MRVAESLCHAGSIPNGMATYQDLNGRTPGKLSSDVLDPLQNDQDRLALEERLQSTNSTMQSLLNQVDNLLKTINDDPYSYPEKGT